MEHNLLQRTYCIAICTKSLCLLSHLPRHAKREQAVETVSVSVKTLVAGLSIHQGHGLKASKTAQTWHCSTQQHAGDEDNQSTSLTYKMGKYLAVSAQLNRAI